MQYNKISPQGRPYQGSLHVCFVLAVASLASHASCSGHVSAGDGRGSPDDSIDDGNGVTGPTLVPVGDPEVNQLNCSPSAGTTPGAPLRRLTRAQYINTLNDLLGAAAAVPSDLQLPDEAIVNGFDNNAATQTSTLSLMQGYRNAAASVAKEATKTAAKLAQLAPCSSGQSEDACADKFVKEFGRRAFRRPLATDEAQRLTKVFAAVKPGSGYAAAIEATLTAFLMAPDFLFRPEYGSGKSDGGALKLTSHEVATRLSYLLWDTMPDATLFAAADANKLDTADGIQTQLKRMLEDPRAHAAVQRFETQWLSLSKLDKIEKDKSFSAFTQETKVSMRSSIEKFLEYAFWTKGSLRALLTDSNAFVDDKLAPIYGVDATGGMKMVSLDAQQRSGIMTQAGVMAALAKPSFDSPVHRGLFVMNNLLCSSVPPPPNDVPSFEAPKTGDAPKTTRERIEQSHSQPRCAACHERIDGVGFGFEHYDAIGSYRDQENGSDVDARGELVGTRDIDGTFDGAAELGVKLAQSSQVQQCVATQWYRYGFGKTETEQDACALKPIVDSFVANRGDMKKLLTTLVLSDAFRYRNAL